MRPVILILAAALAAFCQTSAQKEPPPGTLRAMQVEGNVLYKTQEIIQATGLKIGQPVTAAALEQARLNLTATDLFSNVEDEYR
jgi:hemolysin activation/secretion protein